MVTAIILHHSSDLDGYGSAVTAIKWLEEQNFYIKIKMVPINYNIYNFRNIQSMINEINKTSTVWVFILDFSHQTIEPLTIKIEEYLQDKQICKFAVTNDKQKNYFFNFDFTNEKAAIHLTWEMLNENIAPNIYINYINNLDLWKFDKHEIIYFREFVYKLTWKNYKFLKSFIFNQQILNLKGEQLDEVINTVGKLFIDKKNDQLKKTANKFISGYLNNFKACVFNNTISEINSDMLNYMCREHGYDIALSYYDDLVNDVRGFSIRCVNEKIHVGKIAKKFGGGGHKKAAGFSIKLENGNDFIQKIKNGKKENINNDNYKE